MWSTVHIKLDLTYWVRVLSRYVYNLSQIHCALIKRVLRYVVDITNVDLTFRKQSEDDLINYNDSDFAELKDKRYSIDEYVFMLIDEAISHSSKQQQTIALSSCEIELWLYRRQQKKLFESVAFFMSWILEMINQFIYTRTIKMLLI